DKLVTGVQTCALPICRVAGEGRLDAGEAVGILPDDPLARRLQVAQGDGAAVGLAQPGEAVVGGELYDRAQRVGGVQPEGAEQGQIGRASCRERVGVWV